MAMNRWDLAIADLGKLVELLPHSAYPKGELAVCLADCPDARYRDPKRAIELAKQALALEPNNGGVHNTLGIAYYRAGDWKAAINALEKSMEVREGGDSNDWFFLAMAYWQWEQKEQARTWLDRAVKWMDKNRPNDKDLGRFRAEAESLLNSNE
jgi:tetratricopeptide (TPR) repeat protein